VPFHTIERQIGLSKEGWTGARLWVWTPDVKVCVAVHGDLHRARDRTRSTVRAGGLKAARLSAEPRLARGSSFWNSSRTYVTNSWTITSQGHQKGQQLILLRRGQGPKLIDDPLRFALVAQNRVRGGQ